MNVDLYQEHDFTFENFLFGFYKEIENNLDFNNPNYNQLLQICAIVSSLDISICVSLIGLVNGLLTELFVGFISIVAFFSKFSI